LTAPKVTESGDTIDLCLELGDEKGTKLEVKVHMEPKNHEARKIYNIDPNHIYPRTQPHGVHKRNSATTTTSVSTYIPQSQSIHIENIWSSEIDSQIADSSCFESDICDPLE